MKQIIQFFIKNYKFTYILMAFTIIYGLMGLSQMNSESFPNVNFATATITTMYPGASPDTIEELITKPIEDEIRTVKGLKDTKSTSQAGKSIIVVRVDMDHYDVDTVMDDLQKSVQRVSNLPADLRERPKFEELNSEEFPAIELAILGDNTNRKRDAFADFLKDRLEDNKMVRNVRLVGFSQREFSVKLDAKKLQNNYVSIAEVLTALKKRNQNIPAGNIESTDQQYLVTLDGKVQNIEELKNIVVRANFSGKEILLKDIAQVVDGAAESEVLASVNGEEATLMVVTKKGGQDTIELVTEIQEVLKNTKVPDGLEIKVYNNESAKVKNRMNVLQSNALTGLVLVVVFLLIFLPGVIGVFASLSLPIAIMGTFGMMYSLGMNLDAITILAIVIALGMLVDNSVVISEYFSRLVQDGMDIYEAAWSAAYQFWLPITCTAMTTIAAFLPMLVTKGVMGEFIKFIPIIVTISLVLSLIESFFLLPARLIFSTRQKSHHLQNATHKKNSDWFMRVSDKFESLMAILVRRRYIVSVFFSLLIIGSLFMLVKVNKFILFPAEQTEIYIARLIAPTGTPLEKMHTITQEVSRKVKAELGKDLENIVARSGVSQTDPGDSKARESDNVGMLVIYVTRDASFNLKYTDALRRLRTIEQEGLDELNFEVQVNGPPVGNPVEATFRSNNKKQLEHVTQTVISRLKEIPGIINPQTDDIHGDDEIKIMLDHEKVARHGLNLQSVGDAVKTALEGTLVTEITLDNKKFDLQLKFAENYTTKTSDLSNIKVMDNNGNLVELSKLARLEVVPGSPIIKRFDFQRSKNVVADIDEEQITSIVANQKVLEIYNELKKEDPEVSIVFGGEQENTNESMESLGNAMVLALIGIFGILVFLFSSYLRPVIIMSTIPLGLFGFAVAFYFHDRPVSFLAMIGVIGLSGIIVNSGIVLISYIDDLRKEGQMNLDEILVKASGMRLKAVLVTSLTTVSGLFPTAYGIGGSDLMLIPMTLAMAWGLTSGTLLTLIWVPCAYRILEDWTNFLDRLFGRQKPNSPQNDSVLPHAKSA
ncbi:MAG TPA: efflux RND transporter permease subunit [Oligoflexia bacterium]|nr:efflux RND transporter permease subunit [Oligoflexia bacterium]